MYNRPLHLREGSNLQPDLDHRRLAIDQALQSRALSYIQSFPDFERVQTGEMAPSVFIEQVVASSPKELSCAVRVMCAVILGAFIMNQGCAGSQAQVQNNANGPMFSEDDAAVVINGIHLDSFTRPEYARSHSKSIYSHYLEIAKKKFGNFGVSDKYSEPDDEDYTKKQALLDDMNAKFLSQFTEDYVIDPNIVSELKKRPSVATFESKDFFKAFKKSRAEGAWSRAVGFVYGNHLFLDYEGLKSKDTRMFHILAHEMHHYVAGVNGDYSARWSDDERRFRDDGYSWMHEAFTDFLTREMTKEFGYETSVGYLPETLLASMIQDVVVAEYGEKGKAVLRKAYFTGDFTEVGNTIDKSLGKGVFTDLFMSSTPIKSLGLIVKKFKEKGFDISHSGLQIALLLRERIPFDSSSSEKLAASNVFEMGRKSCEVLKGENTVDILDEVFSMVNGHNGTSYDKDRISRTIEAITVNPGDRGDLMNQEFLDLVKKVVDAQPFENFSGEQDTFTWILSGMFENPNFDQTWLDSGNMDVLADIVRISMQYPEVGGTFKILFQINKDDIGSFLTPDSIEVVKSAWIVKEQGAEDLDKARKEFYDIFRNPDFVLSDLKG